LSLSRPSLGQAARARAGFQACWRQSRRALECFGLLTLGTWENKSISPSCLLLCREPGSGEPHGSAANLKRAALAVRRVKGTPTTFLHRGTPWQRDVLGAGPFTPGPTQATAPPLCWSKPSRTPADSDRWPAARVWLRYVLSPRLRIVVCGPMLVWLSKPTLNGVVNYSFVALLLPCLVCVACL
jgi:hypothetical protein